MNRSGHPAGGDLEAKSIADLLNVERLPSDRTLDPAADLFDLAGRWSLVWAGAPSLRTEATVTNLASLGSNVVVVGANREWADEAARAAGRFAVLSHAITSDPSDRSGAADVVAQAASLAGRIDNAIVDLGIEDRELPGRAVRFVDTKPAESSAVVDFRLKGVLNVARPLLQQMAVTGGGRIVLVVEDEDGRVPFAVGTACVAGVLGFARNVAHETADYGVALASVHIHHTTDSADRWNEPYAAGDVDSAPSRTARLVADTISFLATDAAGYVHGTTLDLDLD